ncbi:L-threonylcarbamoyladenylate synthase [Streptomyces sp. UMAF16]|nr:L-threonylcarbamoyladenylate synthase [Streptomyces sp. UMAF16]
MSIHVAADAAGIAAAVKTIAEGGVVVLPTDTVYGFFGDATNPETVERVYAIKNRDRGKPFVIHTRTADVQRWAHLTPSAETFIEHFWPGPLALVLNKREVIGDWFTHGLPTVAVMSSRNHVMRGVAEALRVPVFGTTLNYAGETEIKTFADAQIFDKDVDLILSGDELSRFDKPSSMIDCTSEPAAVIRLSATGMDELRAVVPSLALAPERRK